ncbi:methyltransferase family protein [Hyphococcus sp.]|uniref:methyltransferase family protein n=1 Tax=Hyphococcus sp. TaxID=2038636 RepID=UPI0035C73056
MTTSAIIQSIGIGAGAIFVIILLWSALVPQLRIWPPQDYSRVSSGLTWLGTLGIFGPALWLGVSDWNALDLVAWLRFGPGLVAVILGNLIVWPAAFRFGYDQTSGAEGELMTDGLYRYSRNPQYVADILMLAGWALLSASASALPVVALGIAALITAPFAEEPWLKAVYGNSYEAYMRRTPRFIGLPTEARS